MRVRVRVRVRVGVRVRVRVRVRVGVGVGVGVRVRRGKSGDVEYHVHEVLMSCAGAVRHTVKQVDVDDEGTWLGAAVDAQRIDCSMV